MLCKFAQTKKLFTFVLFNKINDMKKIILSLSILSTLASCKKEENEILYKYVYVTKYNFEQSNKVKVVNTHIYPLKAGISTAGVKKELETIRLTKNSNILIDTLVLLNENVNNELFNKLNK